MINLIQSKRRCTSQGIQGFRGDWGQMRERPILSDSVNLPLYADYPPSAQADVHEPDHVPDAQSEHPALKPIQLTCRVGKPGTMRQFGQFWSELAVLAHRPHAPQTWRREGPVRCLVERPGAQSDALVRARVDQLSSRRACASARCGRARCRRRLLARHLNDTRSLVLPCSAVRFSAERRPSRRPLIRSRENRIPSQALRPRI